MDMRYGQVRKVLRKVAGMSTKKHRTAKVPLTSTVVVHADPVSGLVDCAGITFMSAPSPIAVVLGFPSQNIAWKDTEEDLAVEQITILTERACRLLALSRSIEGRETKPSG